MRLRETEGKGREGYAHFDMDQNLKRALGASAYL